MMTPQESQSLRDFLDQLTQVRGVNKDSEASSMIAAAVAQQPDAAYLLVQRALLQDQAMTAARAQITQLQSQLQAERDGARGGTGGNFLDPANAWGNSAHSDQRGTGMAPMRQAQRYENAPPAQYAPPPQQFAPPPQAAYGAPARSGFFGSGGSGSSFLGSMAATAAGVAGGAFLFQGIENLMGHHGGANGLMGQGGGAFPTENTTVNNFYGADDQTSGAGNDRTSLADTSIDNSADNTVDDSIGNDDFGSNDDLGSSDDMSSI